MACSFNSKQDVYPFISADSLAAIGRSRAKFYTRCRVENGEFVTIFIFGDFICFNKWNWSPINYVSRLFLSCLKLYIIREFIANDICAIFYFGDKGIFCSKKVKKKKQTAGKIRLTPSICSVSFLDDHVLHSFPSYIILSNTFSFTKLISLLVLVPLYFFTEWRKFSKNCFLLITLPSKRRRNLAVIFWLLLAISSSLLFKIFSFLTVLCPWYYYYY